MTDIEDLDPIMDNDNDDFELFSFDELIKDTSISLALKDAILLIQNKGYKDNTDKFNVVVKALAEKDDKSDAGKLIAASAYNKDAFKAVKAAMGDKFNVVVKALAEKDDKSDAGKLIVASAHTTDAFKAVKARSRPGNVQGTRKAAVPTTVYESLRKVGRPASAPICGGAQVGFFQLYSTALQFGSAGPAGALGLASLVADSHCSDGEFDPMFHVFVRSHLAKLAPACRYGTSGH
jgi:hypothetical protein